MKDKRQEHLVELQRQVNVARNALLRIASGHGRNPEAEASNALDVMWPMDRKQPLQPLVGHGRAQ